MIELEAYRCYKRALQILVFNILHSNIFSLRQFKDILLPINNFHGPIWLPFSNVTCNGLPVCEFCVDLQITMLILNPGQPGFTCMKPAINHNFFGKIFTLVITGEQGISSQTNFSTGYIGEGIISHLWHRFKPGFNGCHGNSNSSCHRIHITYRRETPGTTFSKTRLWYSKLQFYFQSSHSRLCLHPLSCHLGTTCTKLN